jgi:DNA-binding transcriptional MerR regulator
MSHSISETSYLPITMPVEDDKASAKKRDKKRDKKAEAEAKSEATDSTPTYSIDELAAKTNVASRTIRFYQGKGILDKPRRQGRKAFYTEDHITRLKLIAQLQDRGLRIRGMRQLLARGDSETAVSEWLGLSDKLSEPWSKERALALDEGAMTKLIGERPAGTLAAVLRSGLAERRDEPPKTYFIPSPGLLDVALRLLDSGLSLEVLATLEPILRDGLRHAAEGVVDYFLEEGDLGKPGDEDKLTSALDALRVQGANAVSIIFAQEIERTLGSLIEDGAPSKRSRRRRRR